MSTSSFLKLKTMRFVQALGSGLLGAIAAFVLGVLVSVVGYWIARCEPVFGSCDNGWRGTAGDVVLLAGAALIVVVAPLLLIGLTIYRIRKPLS
jgi:hypothetical protein